MALLHRLLASSSYRISSCSLSSKRLLSSMSSNNDLENIMSMLGFGKQAPALDTAADYLTTRKAVSDCLERLGHPTKQSEREKENPPLTQIQQEELKQKVSEWIAKYQREWDIKNQIEAAKQRRQQNIPANEALSSLMDNQSETILEKATKKEQDLIMELLPEIAEKYVRGNFNWDREYVRLEEEIQRTMLQKKAEEFTKAYLDSDPLRAYVEPNQEPVIVQLSTLLEHIDPRFASKLKDSGMKLEGRKIDMSRPNEVVKVLTDLGYSVNKDGELNDTHHLTFPFDVHERENLMRGLLPNGAAMSEETKWRKILETPEISSPALDHKRRQIDFFMRQQRQQDKVPPLSTSLNPELLPEELRPTIEDLDPDTKPVFVNRDVVRYDNCPICQKPRTGPGSRKRCGLSKDTEPNVTHTNVELLTEFVNELGMILPKKKTGVCSKQQRQIARAIKRSRQMGLMPYTTKLKFGKSFEGPNFQLYNLFRRHNLLENRQSSSSSSL